MQAKIAVLGGDGIGPEVVAEAVKVLAVISKRFGHEFEFATAMVGGCAYDRFGTGLPDETLALCDASE